ncbi:FAD-binding oxidoreductase [Streptoalloteichus tenebrarius]|uniref:FAD-binding oxidoreductase n=1 Tax=Streptoalloteichus tenebrarius (strain ATCC 17920 / DSM 40477 / JCM 4838 / CBS 697.72 / NBRC 16177 / NCIMB 11028 / NRRL B-12390 / A12253. 1 / ISP 5477) TaxID=1933 RepID=UPI0020A440EA|nr:FAD-binding oxidoreductase [Streptoalloteichus tenebrarius]BFF01328.1 FAD-binding oxidoreductase [Streptoalloteichus tenebrarius]
MTEAIDHTVRGSWTPAGGARSPLPAHALRWLRARTGLEEGSTPAGPSSVLPVAESALPESARAALAGVVDDANVLLDRDSRLGRTGGLSYVDLIRRRSGAGLAAPDAVVLPETPAQVQRVLDVCVEHDIAVVPFGGGTSVVGGVTALRGDKRAVVALDLAQLDRLVSVDPVSRIAVLQAGVRAPDAERLLGAHGLTLGHFPQSFERATIGGFAATRSAGQASSGYGRFEDMVEGLRMATPVGEWRLGVAPASAAGPDLRQLVLGSEGTLGVITEVALRVRPAPTVRRYEGFVVDGWERGVAVVRALAQQRELADVTRLSDMDETEVSVALSGGLKTKALRAYLNLRGVDRPCLLVLGWEAEDGRELAWKRAAALRIVHTFSPVTLGSTAGESWRHNRFAGPRQRDALLDVGVCVETLETATHWSAIPALWSSVRGALTDALTAPGRRPVVMCHISHAYETGASLYFTAIVPRDPDDPVGQWQRAKAAACQAIAGAGGTPVGTITHHHAVGTDHRPWLSGEIGEVGASVLDAVKRRLDPTGILNPGKLIPTPGQADQDPQIG